MSRSGFSDEFGSELYDPDVEVVTSGGVRIPAHSSILAMASPVLENVMERLQKHQRSSRLIPILGVPCEAVSAFIRCLYTSSRCSVEGMILEKYGIHLLALSHVYAVHQLKQRCIKSLATRLSIENVIDVLQLARLCDAPDLQLKCMKLISINFKSVEKTEGWKFLHKHDPWLELDILQFIDESESRRKRSKRHRQEQCVYLQLSVAMDCLAHIWTDGCTIIGPYDAEANKNRPPREPCTNFSTCYGLQLLVKHFATCDKRSSGEVCCQCKRVLQLLRLHACLCDQQSHICRVPLCRQFKMKMQQEKRDDNAKWRLLAKKVVVAKAASALSIAAKRKRDNNNDQQLSDRDQFRINQRRLHRFRLCQREANQIHIVQPV